jgi:hypothetical protein
MLNPKHKFTGKELQRSAHQAKWLWARNKLEDNLSSRARKKFIPLTIHGQGSQRYQSPVELLKKKLFRPSKIIGAYGSASNIARRREIARLKLLAWRMENYIL